MKNIILSLKMKNKLKILVNINQGKKLNKKKNLLI